LEEAVMPEEEEKEETWSLTLREEQVLRVFENRMLRRILGPKRESGEDYITRNLMICTYHQILS
jgi:hypothetical protein